MPKYEVEMTFNNWRDFNGKRVTAYQEQSGKTPEDAARAATENLFEEYRNDAEDVRVKAVREVKATLTKGGAKVRKCYRPPKNNKYWGVCRD